MKINGPKLESVRKKFYWWPRRVTVFKSKFYASGAPPVPYQLGWYHSAYPSSIGSPRYGKQRPQPLASLNQGMVTPVEQKTIFALHAWVWLEWILEEYVTISRDQSYHRGAWVPVRTGMYKQWNVWHEYD